MWPRLVICGSAACGSLRRESQSSGTIQIDGLEVKELEVPGRRLWWSPGDTIIYQQIDQMGLRLEGKGGTKDSEVGRDPCSNEWPDVIYLYQPSKKFQDSLWISAQPAMDFRLAWASDCRSFPILLRVASGGLSTYVHMDFEFGILSSSKFPYTSFLEFCPPVRLKFWQLLISFCDIWSFSADTFYEWPEQQQNPSSSPLRSHTVWVNVSRHTVIWSRG